MNGLFWVCCNFPISFSGSYMSRNLYNRLLWSSLVDTGILSKYVGNLSRVLQDILKHDHILLHPLLIRHYTNLWPCTELELNTTEFDLFTKHSKKFPKNICNGYGIQLEYAYSIGYMDTWSCLILDVHVFKCWDQSLKTVSCFRLEFRTSLSISMKFNQRPIVLGYIQVTDQWNVHYWHHFMSVIKFWPN